MDFSFDHQFDKHVVGIDEVGRGSWAGPVMACASLLNDKIPICLLYTSDAADE